MKRILMILTSHRDMVNTDRKTGLWLGEFTEPYYMFKDEGHAVSLASPQGGEPPLDPLSELTRHITAANRRFNNDPGALGEFRTTQRLEQIDAAHYDALFIPGGHGPMWDLATNAHSGKIIADLLAQGKPVAAVCHGPAALLKAAEMQPGLLHGRRVTAYSNLEENLALLANKVPYKLEDRLKELGAEYRSAMVPFMPCVEVAGPLITGQNPLSAGPTAKALLKLQGQ